MPYHNEIIWQFPLFLFCFCFFGVCICSSYHFNGNCDKYIHCLQLPITSPEERSRGYHPYRSITHPPRKGWQHHRVSTSPALFEQWCGFFYVRQEPDKWKSCETGHGFSSLSEIPVLPTRKLEKQWTLLNFSTRRVNAVLFGIAEVTFESVDEILWYDHSKESSSTVLSRSTICDSAFSKIKFGIQSLSYFHFNHLWK